MSIGQSHLNINLNTPNSGARSVPLFDISSRKALRLNTQPAKSAVSKPPRGIRISAVTISKRSKHSCQRRQRIAKTTEIAVAEIALVRRERRY